MQIFTQAIKKLNIYIFCKDNYGRFIFANDQFAEVAGLDSCLGIIGKTDEDLVWRNQAPLYREGDLRTMRGYPFNNIHEIM